MENSQVETRPGQLTEADEAQECRRLNSQGNNSAHGAELVKQVANNNAAPGANDEAAAKAAKKQAFLEKKLNDPKNLRMFTSDNNLLGPYWEQVTGADQRESFPPRDEPPGLSGEERVQHKFAVEFGQNIAKWHQQNKPVVCEYLLFLKDENLNLLKPQYSAIIRKCSRKSKCFILITNRILNKQVGKFKWIKYLIVQIQGPDYTMVKICNTMLERWFPEYRQRLVYNKQRFKFGIYTTENSVDNMELYFPYQRSNKCSVNYGDMHCETPYGATEQRTILDSSWKQNNRLFAAGNLVPCNGPVKTAQAYVFAFHPLGTQDKFHFRSQFGVKEPPRTFTPRDDIGYPNSSLCGPDFPGHQLAKRQQRGYSGMVSAYLRVDASVFVSSLRVFTLAESLGGFESLAEVPSIMTHASVPPEQRAELGITDSFVRLSVGLEDVDDLLADLDQALEAAAASVSGAPDAKRSRSSKNGR